MKLTIELIKDPDKLSDDALDAHYFGLIESRQKLINYMRFVGDLRTRRAYVAEGQAARRERALSDMSVEELEAELERRKLDQTVKTSPAVTLAEVFAP